MSWLEEKYLNLISYRLDGFKRKSSNLYNFRCPFCGDSDSNKKKMRGYIYDREGHYVFYCHNKCAGVQFKTFLKRLDERLYKEFLLEKMKEIDNKIEIPEIKKVVLVNTEPAFAELIALKKISQLKWDHPAKKYINERLIPTPYHAILRWCPDFMKWTNILKPGKFEKEALQFDCGRIIIPFFNEKNHFYSYQGRKLGGGARDQDRYIAINLDHNEPMLFGLNNLSDNKSVKVFEGPLDAMFLDNSIAIAGSNFSGLTRKLDRDRVIMIYDNEPHSKDGRSKIAYAIDQGFKVVIWPDYVVEKDINAMIMNGSSLEYLEYIIKENTFHGLGAKLRLNNWSKS